MGEQSGQWCSWRFLEKRRAARRQSLAPFSRRKTGKMVPKFEFQRAILSMHRQSDATRRVPATDQDCAPATLVGVDQQRFLAAGNRAFVNDRLPRSERRYSNMASSNAFDNRAQPRAGFAFKARLAMPLSAAVAEFQCNTFHANNRSYCLVSAFSAR